MWQVFIQDMKSTVVLSGKHDTPFPNAMEKLILVAVDNNITNSIKGFTFLQ